MADTIPHHKLSFRQIVLFLTAFILVSISILFFWTLADRFMTVDPNSTPVDNRVADGQQPTITATVYKETLESGVSIAQTAQLPTVTPTFTSSPSPTPSATASPTLLPSPTASLTPLPSPTASPTLLPTPRRGTTRVSPVDHMVSIYIPAGSFNMGVNGDGRTDEPKHLVTLDAFWINRTPVTNAMYAKCVHAGGCNNPIRKALNPHYYDSAYANHPVVYVTWFDAQKYCKWIGGRLPTEAQWERAASDNGHRIYPWGNTNPKPNLANVNNFYDTTTKVGSHPAGASPFGVLDLGGDVREWVSDWYSPTYYKHSPTDNPTGPAKGELKVLRGASWFDPIVYSRVSSRLAHFPGSAGDNRGFRCVISE